MTDTPRQAPLPHTEMGAPPAAPLAPHGPETAKTDESRPRQPLFESMKRGFACRCPACNTGKIYRSYLKVADTCPACGLPLHLQRADDFPPYVIIFLLPHIMIPLAWALEQHYAPPMWVHMVIWPPVILALTLLLLPPVKGAIIALQWHMGMHGFDPAVPVSIKQFTDTPDQS